MGISQIQRIEYNDYAVRSISSFDGFKVHYKELIDENLTALSKTMDEINNCKPDAQDKKSEMKTIEIESAEVTENIKNFVKKINLRIELEDLEKYKSILTKNVYHSDITSFEKAYDFIVNLSNSYSNYPALLPIKEDVESYLVKFKDITSRKGEENRDKKHMIININDLNKRWDNYYSVLKHLIKAHFIEDEAKYKSFFADLK